MKFKNFLNEAQNPVITALKKAGYTSKQFGCRYNGYAYRVNIKDLSLDKKEIEKIAKQYQSIDYDERTGEILSGGNTFVFVDYDSDVYDKAYDDYKPKVVEIIKKCIDKDNIGSYVKIENGLEICYPCFNYPEILNRHGYFSEVFGRRNMDRVYSYKFKGKKHETILYSDKIPLFLLLIRCGIKP